MGLNDYKGELLNQEGTTMQQQGTLARRNYAITMQLFRQERNRHLATKNASRWQ